MTSCVVLATCFSNARINAETLGIPSSGVPGVGGYDAEVANVCAVRRPDSNYIVQLVLSAKHVLC